MKFLIPAPHSFCEPEIRDRSIEKPSNRHCDRAAYGAADALKSVIEENEDDSCVVHKSDRLRFPENKEGLDYNRHPTNTHPWRKELRRLADDLEPDFIIEAHSYPGEHDIFKKEPIWNSCQLVLLKSEFNASFVDKLAKTINDELTSARELAKKKLAAARGLEVKELALSRKLLSAKSHPPDPEEPVIKVGVTVPLGNHPVAITDDFGYTYPHTLFEFDEQNDDETNLKLARAIIASLKKLRPQIEFKPSYGGKGDGKDCTECKKTFMRLLSILLTLVVIAILITIIIASAYLIVSSLSDKFTDWHRSPMRSGPCRCCSTGTPGRCTCSTS